MTDVETYQSLIQLLKLALEFYANENHYVVNKPMNGECYSSIELDGGGQARFALDRITEFNKLVAELDEIQGIEQSLNDLLKAEPNGAAFIKIIENYQKMQRIDNGEKI